MSRFLASEGENGKAFHEDRRRRRRRSSRNASFPRSKRAQGKRIPSIPKRSRSPPRGGPRGTIETRRNGRTSRTTCSDPSVSTVEDPKRSRDAGTRPAVHASVVEEKEWKDAEGRTILSRAHPNLTRNGEERMGKGSTVLPTDEREARRESMSEASRLRFHAFRFPRAASDARCVPLQRDANRFPSVASSFAVRRKGVPTPGMEVALARKNVDRTNSNSKEKRFVRFFTWIRTERRSRRMVLSIEDERGGGRRDHSFGEGLERE